MVTEHEQWGLATGRSATVLGPTTLDGRSPTPRQRAIVAALTLHRDREVDTDTLIDTVWGEWVPAAARQSLQNQIGRLRAAHGPDVIITGPRGYRLGRATDVEQFVDLVAPHVGAPADRSRIAPLAAGLALWRGVPYADLPESPAVEAERAQLTELHALAGEHLAEARLASGAVTAALQHLTGLTREDPYRERRWLLLMTALHQAGRRAEALDAYRQLSELLARDLRTRPSEAARDLRDVIAEGQIIDLGPAPATDGAGDARKPCSVRRAQRRQRTCPSAS